MTRLAIAAALTVPLAGCFGTYQPLMDDETGSTSTGDSSGGADVPSSTTAGSDSSSGAADESSSDTTTGAPVRDTTGGPDACDHIDVLVVVDMSSSMADYLNGGLLQGLFAVTDAGLDTLDSIGSYHIGLTTNGGLPSNAMSSTLPDAEDCTEVGSLIRPLTESCEGAVGEHPFIDETSNLVPAFTCLIQGALGDVSAAEEHRTIDAIGNALSADANAEGSCNAGFHADDDPLLIIVASDGEDLSMMDPQQIAGPFQSGTPRQVTVAVFGGPVCECERPEPRECNAEGCAAAPPCRVQEVTNLLFASIDPDEQTRFTELCSTPDEIEAGLEFALNDLAALACEGAATAD